MAPLRDPVRLLHFRTCLSFWSFECYIHWKQVAAEWVYHSLEGLSLVEVGRLVNEYVTAEGEIDEIRETRPEWADEFEFHHDLRLEIVGRQVYVETVLEMGREPEDSTIHVVSIHDA